MFRKKIFLSLKFLVLVLFAGSSFTNCSGFHVLNFSSMNNMDSSSLGGFAGNTNAGIEAFKVTAYPLLQANCSGCHGASQIPLHSSADLKTAYNAAFTKLSLSKPEDSILAQKAGDNHCKSAMGNANCVTSAAQIKAAIIAWAAHETSSGVLEAASNSRLRIGNRRYVSSKLIDLFGSAANPHVANLITKNITNFGGPCDKYRGDFNSYGESYGVPKGDCDSIANSQTAVMAPNIASRLAVVNRVCNRILQEDTAVNNIVTKGFGSTNPITDRRPNDSDLQTLYGLFYIGRLGDSTVISALKTLSDKAQSLGYANIESWRFPLIALCQSPDWQIP